jgi:hypothetical protein
VNGTAGGWLSKLKSARRRTEMLSRRTRARNGFVLQNRLAVRGPPVEDGHLKIATVSAI